MADQKLSQLTAVTPTTADAVYLLDTSDTTDGPAGSSKRATVANVLGLVSTTVSDTTALGTLTNDTAPLFLLSGKSTTGDFVRKTTPGASGLSLLLAADSAAVLALLGTGTPGSGNFLRGDGSWQSVSASPGGSNTQVQFNNAGAFGGAAALTYAASGTHLLATAQTATDIPLVLKTAGSQTADYRQTRLSDDTVIESLNRGGGFGSRWEVYNTDRTSSVVAWPQTATNASIRFTGSSSSLHFIDFGAPNDGSFGAGFWRLQGDRSTSFFDFAGTGSYRVASQFAVGESGMAVYSTARLTVGQAAADRINLAFTAKLAKTADSIVFTHDSSTTSNQPSAVINEAWADSTHATRSGRLTFSAYYTSTAQEGLRVEGNTAGVRLGFYGATAVAKPTGVPVTAADIHAALVSLGLIAA